MPNYEVITTVVYTYEIQADSEELAEAEGWKYEDYKQHAEVDSINVTELDSDQEDEDEDED